MPKRTWYLRVTEPEKNTFLLAPLAKSAGGTQACGEAVFRDKSDPDYQRLLATFQPIRDLLAGKPRFDMMTPQATDAPYCAVETRQKGEDRLFAGTLP